MGAWLSRHSKGYGRTHNDCGNRSRTAAGNTLPLLLGEGLGAGEMVLLLANLNSLAFDYVARQKAQTTHLNWYILEQLPVIAPKRFQEALPAAFAEAMRTAELMNGHHPNPTVAGFVIPLDLL